LTKDGVSSIVSWRADGRELYYRKGDMSDSLTMSVAVTLTSVNATLRPPCPQTGHFTCYRHRTDHLLPTSPDYKS
jgi:hypothetical protein